MSHGSTRRYVNMLFGPKWPFFRAGPATAFQSWRGVTSAQAARSLRLLATLSVNADQPLLDQQLLTFFAEGEINEPLGHFRGPLVNGQVKAPR